MTEELPIPEDRPWRRREYSGAGSTLGVAALVVLAVAVGIWLLEFRGSDAAPVDTGGLGIVPLPKDQNPTGKGAAAEPGRAAPNFRLQNLAGEEVELTQFRGQPVLINFWASWCVPCRGETPDLQAAFEAGGIVILGVNQQETAGQAAAFRDEFGVTYPILLDPNAEVSAAYRVPGIPVSVLLDTRGVIRRIFVARVTTDQLAEALAELPR